MKREKRSKIALLILVALVAGCASHAAKFDKDFLEKHFSIADYHPKGGTILVDSEGNLDFLWVHSNMDSLNWKRNPEDWEKIKFRFFSKLVGNKMT